ncbi:MAG: hydrogenase maturation nickel metallochaperone HypA [Phycisphaerae bacterium]|nr:hydrogenase maturation nickel metallochaperone HypA [Phycisphaerae bacterium]
MHEFSIARSLVDAACVEARRVGASRVTTLTCRIGVLRQVDDWLMKEAFDIAKCGTLCDKATLHIEKAYMQALCTECQARFPVRDWDWNCPACGMPGEDATGGDELVLLSLDAEIPDENTSPQECV